MQDEEENDSYQDRITDILLNGSVYQKVKIRTYRWFSAPVPKRLKWQAILLFSLAAIYPVMSFLPTTTKEKYFRTTEIATTSPTVALLAAACIVFTVLGAAGHLGAVYLRIHWQSNMTRQKAQELLSLEEASSVIGVGTAGIGASVTHFLTSLGYSGTAVMRKYSLTPYELSGSVFTVEAVAIIAVLLGTFLYIAGCTADVRLSEENLTY